ncbi:MAG: cytochrome P450 [Reyranella sp.]|uniref:cytochrome P450 n=1 Tax=Reyranella sp. TaxID=1929291 RepID=UPI003D14CDA7
MVRLMWTRQRIREERGPDWFVPAHPAPPTGHFGAVERLLSARRSLIGAFHEADYVSGCGSMRVFGRRVILVNSPETIKYVMVTNHENYERKSPQLRRALKPIVGDGLFISDGETWKRRRPLVADIVHKDTIPRSGRSMEAAVADMADRWQARPAGTVFNALPEMAGLTAEIIARAVFGQKLGAAAALDIVSGFSRFQRLVDSVNIPYFLGADDGWPLLRGPRLRKAIADIGRVIDKVVADHIAGHGDHNSMLEVLVRRQARSPELGLDVGALREEAATIFMAGHEGSTATLTWALYLLANAPWVEEAVQREVETVVGDRRPTIADIPDLAWCRAVIEETLRLYPSIPIMARQALSADRIGDVAVEANDLVLVVSWLLHRANDLWDRPHHFLPERFLGAKRPLPYTYIPFGVGPRTCPGLGFGMAETVLCLASLAQRFTIRVADGHRVVPSCRLSLRPLGGLPVIATARG